MNVKALLSRRMTTLVFLGFSSGLPLALISGTLQAWMTDAGISLTALGIFSLTTLPYALKFLWSPFLDRYIAPVFGAHGRRLGWILCSQFTLMLLIATLALLHPETQIYALFIVCTLVAFVSATQDVVVDAYRADLLVREELGPGASAAIFGYRIGMLTSGALALSLAQVLPWKTVYCTMAIVQGIGVVATLMAPRIDDAHIRPKTISEAVVQPFLEYFKRRGAYEILLFIVLYKLSDVMTGMFTTRFMLELGFAKAEIAAVVKGLGLAATIVGSIAGGTMLLRIGMKRGLILFGILQGASTLTFALLAHVGKDYAVMASAIALENLCAGLSVAAFTAFLTGLCHHRFTATQYALLTSVAALSRSFMGVPCGYFAAEFHWPLYFVLCAVAGIPGLLLVFSRFERWHV